MYMEKTTILDTHHTSEKQVPCNSIIKQLVQRFLHFSWYEAETQFQTNTSKLTCRPGTKAKTRELTSFKSLTRQKELRHNYEHYLMFPDGPCSVYFLLDAPGLNAVISSLSALILSTNIAFSAARAAEASCIICRVPTSLFGW